MQDCHGVFIPLILNIKLTKSTDKEPYNLITYQKAIRSLMYAILGTQLDLAYVVSTLSQFSSNPNQTYWNTVKHIFQYLKNTMNIGITYGNSDELEIEIYSDADWGGNLDSRKSTSDYVVMLGNGAISWKSKLQSTVAASTMEAKYIRANEATKEAIWIQQLLKELKQIFSIIPIRIDNQSCIALVKNPEYYARSKHIDI